MPKSSTSIVVGFSVPPTLAREVNSLAKRERRTKSELFREMVRVYQRYRKLREREEDQWVMDLIREAQEEQRTNPMTPEELKQELRELAEYGAAQAKKLKIKPGDVNRLIYESRKQSAALAGRR
jgi:predicted transcriptional regulator